MRNAPSRIAPLWSLVGVCLLFSFAIFRLGRRGVEAMALGLTPGQWLALVAFTAGFVYVEGVIALQRRWVPRLLGRARELRAESRLPYRAIAPLYGMSLVAAEPTRMLRSWALVLGIVAAVILISRLPEPWRGIIDLAVAAALAFGLVSIVAALPEFVGRPPIGRTGLEAGG